MRIKIDCQISAFDIKNLIQAITPGFIHSRIDPVLRVVLGYGFQNARFARSFRPKNDIDVVEYLDFQSRAIVKRKQCKILGRFPIQHRIDCRRIFF
ncbi:hypothetical protein GALL_541670 [mine drainage metagenome]|uniref:Uncharacterized protein n=1 Tax=mine drainage metagenome TaxID=410659 RepID=A0A1J5NZS5_9ZZZZ